MRKLLVAIFIAAGLIHLNPATSGTASAASYVEYYRDNLVLGLAYHRVGCLTDWTTIQSGQEYDGFTTYNYCVSGTSSDSVPSGEWYAWDNTTGAAHLNSIGGVGTTSPTNSTNWAYATPNYQSSSTICSYNVLTECNSDCWIRYFSDHVGAEVGTASGCWGNPPRGSNIY